MKVSVWNTMALSLKTMMKCDLFDGFWCLFSNRTTVCFTATTPELNGVDYATCELTLLIARIFWYATRQRKLLTPTLHISLLNCFVPAVLIGQTFWPLFQFCPFCYTITEKSTANDTRLQCTHEQKISTISNNTKWRLILYTDCSRGAKK